MAKKTGLTDEERALFRATVADARPLRQGRQVVPQKPLPSPRLRQRERDDQQVLIDSLSDPADAADLECGDELLFARPGLRHNVLKVLRRGKYTIQASLDLHRMTSDQARAAVVQFLGACHQHDWRCVRIVHGKGHGSFNHQPVLKTRVDHWLRQRDDVLAFCSARPADGGTGAVYVLLRKV